MGQPYVFLGQSVHNITGEGVLKRACKRGEPRHFNKISNRLPLPPPSPDTIKSRQQVVLTFHQLSILVF